MFKLLESKINNNKNFSFLFLSGWLILGLIQAFYTELLHDEAYYWFYSQELSWGYFDHPPAIAAFIKIGYFYFKNELGVRLLIVLTSVLSIYLIEKIVNPHNKFLFFGIISSIAFFHAGSLIAAPDVPLVFFSVTFLYFYKKFLQKEDITNTLILAINVALLLYSKYHGILLVFFVFLANPTLILKKNFWIIVIVSFLLFLPHLYWQFIHDYPTFRYHLSDRSADPYKMAFTFEYIGGQLAILGPFTSIVLLIAAVRYKSQNIFEKTMKFVLYGILGFFLFSSFKGRVEANWTSICAIPLVVLSYYFLSINEKLKNITYKLFIPGVIAFSFVRVLAMYNFLPDSVNLKTEVHGWKQWAEQIKNKTGETPVVFMNSFQQAAKYSFYSGSVSHSLNLVSYSGNQYDLANTELNLQGEDVYFVPEYSTNEVDTVYTNKRKLPIKFIDNFTSFNRIRIKIEEIKTEYSRDEKFIVRFKLVNQFNKPMVLQNPTSTPLHFSYHYFVGKKPYKSIITNIEMNTIIDSKDQSYEIEMIAPEERGKYRFRIALENDYFPAARHGNFTKIEVN